MAVNVQDYKPLHLFSEESTAAADPESCLVILNQDLRGLETVVRKFWHRYSLHVCADGGANRLYNMTESPELYTPHTICGDLDSAQPEVLQFYQQRGSRVLKLCDQDSTDFTKAMKEVLTLKQKGLVNFSSIYAANAIGGRFDQTLGNVQTVMSLEEQLCGTPIYLISEVSIAVLLRPGRSSIAVDSGLEGGYCGLLPIGEPCSTCSTTGLQWNLSRQSMRFGGLVSTSNLLAPGHPTVHVTSSSPLLWTMSHTLCQ